MAVKTNLYAQSKTSQDTGIGPSNSIWYDCPVEDFYGGGGQEPKLGYYFMDHFLSSAGLPAVGTTTQMWGGDRPWAILANTGSIMAQDTQQDGGVLGLACTTSGNTIQLGQLNGWARLISAATGNALTQGKLWFEARVAFGAIGASLRDIFVGMSDNSDPATNALTAMFSGADTLATANGFVGMRARGGTTNPGDWGVVWNVAGGTVQAPTQAQLATLVTNVTGTAPIAYTAGAAGALATGFNKIGFVFDPTPGNPPDTIVNAIGGQTAGQIKKRLVNFYVNGQQANAYLTAADQVQLTTFPNSWMAPTISIRSANTTQLNTTLYIDWIRVAQGANTF